jgi:hypothetical protein
MLNGQKGMTHIKRTDGTSTLVSSSNVLRTGYARNVNAKALLNLLNVLITSYLIQFIPTFGMQPIINHLVYHVTVRKQAMTKRNTQNGTKENEIQNAEGVSRSQPKQ